MRRRKSLDRIKGRQLPGLQDPEIKSWAADRDYHLPDSNVFKLKASARKDNPQHAKVLADVLDGARRGDWTVVVVVGLDRVERKGVFALQGWILDIMRAGCRVESTSPGEEWLGETGDELLWSIRLSVEADRARREAVLRAEKTGRGHTRKDELGQGRVRLKLGWKYRRRAKFDSEIVKDRPAQVAVRAAFREVAKGGTLRTARRAMAAKGYDRSTEQISTIIRDPAYSSGLLEVPALVQVEPVVSAAVQAKAMAVLKDRVSYTGPRNRETNAEHFGGRIFCRRHLAPLHFWPGPPRKDGSRKRYYRGRLAGCDCGLFDADTVDLQTDWLMFSQGQPEYEMVTTGGGDPAEIARIQAQQVQLARKKPPDWLTTMVDLEDKLQAAMASETHRERVETGYDMGEVWQGMNRQEQRRYLERQAEAGNFRLVFWKRPGMEPPVFGAVVDFDGRLVAPHPDVDGLTLEEWESQVTV